MTAKKLIAGLFAAMTAAGAFAPAVVYAQQPGSYKDAISAYEKSDDKAKYAMEIALDYKYGWAGAPRDGKKAIAWLDKAFDAGAVRAATIAGTMYMNGDGLKKDYSKAEKYYRKAASRGDESAKIRLGQMYYYGNGVKVDYKSAAKWYASAAQEYENTNDCSKACVYLGEIYFYGWQEGKQTVRDYVKSVKWLEKAYKAGHIESSDILAVIYSDDHKGIKQNKVKARKFLLSGASKGYNLAIKALIEDYIYGKNGKADPVQAYAWAAVLADRDNSNAALRVLDIAKDGLTSANRAKAEKAASDAVKKYHDVVYEIDTDNID